MWHPSTIQYLLWHRNERYIFGREIVELWNGFGKDRERIESRNWVLYTYAYCIRGFIVSYKFFMKTHWFCNVYRLQCIHTHIIRLHDIESSIDIKIQIIQQTTNVYLTTPILTSLPPPSIMMILGKMWRPRQKILCDMSEAGVAVYNIKGMTITTMSSHFTHSKHILVAGTITTCEAKWMRMRCMDWFILFKTKERESNAYAYIIKSFPGKTRYILCFAWPTPVYNVHCTMFNVQCSMYDACIKYTMINNDRKMN